MARVHGRVGDQNRVRGAAPGVAYGMADFAQYSRADDDVIASPAGELYGYGVKDLFFHFISERFQEIQQMV
jgi:hypothetical protein